MKDRLGNHIQQVRGVSYKPNDLSETLSDGYTTLLRANNICEGKINFDNVQFVRSNKVSPEQILKTNDILVCSSSGSLSLVGKSALYKKTGEHTFGAFCKVVRATGKLLPQYIAFYMCSQAYRRHIENIANGANINNLRNEHLDEILLPILPESRQNAIIAKLEKVQSVISYRQTQLAKLDELVKCRFVEMFIGKGYPRRELQSLIQDGTSISYGIVQPGDDGTGNIGLLRPVDFHNGSVVLDNLKYIGEAISNLSRKSILEGNELLITVRGTTGLTALTNSNHRGMNVTRGIAVVKYDGRKIVPEYLQAFMSSDESQTYIREHTRGATLQQINLSDLRIQSILVPPFVEQQTFADFVSLIDKLRFFVGRV